jgi:hypothetical protein
MQITLNLLLSAALIAIALWIAKKDQILAGFIVSLPLSTLIVLALSKLQNPDTEISHRLAKSIFVGIPATTVFFIPFLLADRFRLSFWTCYGAGFLLLGMAFFIHRYLVGFLVR